MSNVLRVILHCTYVNNCVQLSIKTFYKKTQFNPQLVNYIEYVGTT